MCKELIVSNTTVPTTIGLYKSKCCAGQHVGIATVSVNLSNRDGMVALRDRVTSHETHNDTTVNCSARALKMNCSARALKINLGTNCRQMARLLVI